MVNSISIQDLKKVSSKNLIDIRSIEKYNNGHILDAINIPFEQLLIRPNKYLDKKTIYYIYCQRGVQSRKICQILLNSGYNVINISGGYEAWIINE